MRIINQISNSYAQNLHYTSDVKWINAWSGPTKTGHITASSNRCLGTRALSQYEDRLSQIWDPMLKIRRSWDPLILNIVISLLVRRYLYIETGPWILNTNRWVKPKFHLTIYYTQAIHFRVLLYDTKCLRFIEIYVNFDYEELVFRHIACFILSLYNFAASECETSQCMGR